LLARLCAVLALGLVAAPAAATAASPSLARIGSGLEQLARAQRFSGVVLVARGDTPILKRAFGLADRRTGTPNRLGTRFNLASVGKSFTAVAIGQLVQAGKISFSDKIGKYVPELPRSVGERITIAELLDHTSGLGDYFASPLYARLQPQLTSLAAYLPMIVDDTPVGHPGLQFRYSNSGYILLGLVVQRASGLDYYRYLRRNVFARAGMKESGCFWKDARVPNLAVGYTGPPGARIANTGSLPPRGTSAGGCYSTASDLLRFTRALLGHRLLDAKLTATLTAPRVRAPGGSYGYGFGLRYDRYRNAPTIWHNGGSPGVGAEYDVNPMLGYTVVVLANLDPQTMPPVEDLILNALHLP
jgi:CubicO group peptidase (beta-lactamase class C family)